jgi:hypothetical protein
MVDGLGLLFSDAILKNDSVKRRWMQQLMLIFNSLNVKKWSAVTTITKNVMTSEKCLATGKYRICNSRIWYVENFINNHDALLKDKRKGLEKATPNYANIVSVEWVEWQENEDFSQKV